MKYLNKVFGVFLLITMVLIPSRSVFAFETIELDNPKASTVNIDGYVFYEDGRDPEGIKVELLINGSLSQSMALATTDSDGYYLFENIDTSESYYVSPFSTIHGYIADGTDSYLSSTDLQAATGTYHATSQQMLLRRIYEIEWKYQPDGSTDFTDPNIPEDLIIMASGYHVWYSQGRVSGFGWDTNSFSFALGDYGITGDKDFYVYADQETFNYTGGTHDLGEMLLEDVTSVPDKSNGVGWGSFYDRDSIPLVVGHTYAVVTNQLNYGIFRVKSIFTPLSEVTLDGNIQLEGKTDHSGIHVELHDFTTNSLLDSTITDTNGNYQFNNVLTNQNYIITGGVAYPAFSSVSENYHREMIQLSTGTYSTQSEILLKRKFLVVDWAYQPDGSTSFINPSVRAGSLSFSSPYTLWNSPGNFTYMGLLENGICFKGGTISYYECKDTTYYLDEIYVSNDFGGIHDMGAVSLESVTTAPDKSLGIGGGEYYLQYESIEPIIGHTYVVVTHDGTTYGKFYIREIRNFDEFQVFLPTTIK